MDVLLTVLETILPYLKIKQKQCEVLIQFIKHRREAKPIRRRGYRGVTSFSQQDHEAYKQLLMLNKRGI